MKTYLLVHGAWQGSGCWRKVGSILRTAGHSVITPDIPWSNAEQNSGQSALSWCVDQLIDNLRNDDNVIVVGHSIGSIFISQLAEVIPEKTATLVYLSGFLLKNGQCANDTANLMGDSVVSRNMSLSTDKKNIVLPKEILREAMFEDVGNEDFTYAIESYSNQPLWTFQTPVTLNEERYGSIPKFYIECLKDNAIPITAQRIMQENSACQEIYSLDSSHSPFYSMPKALAAILLAIKKT